MVNNRASVESNSPADLSQPLTQLEMHPESTDLHQAGHLPTFFDLNACIAFASDAQNNKEQNPSESRTSLKCEH